MKDQQHTPGLYTQCYLPYSLMTGCHGQAVTTLLLMMKIEIVVILEERTGLLWPELEFSAAGSLR